jgi:acetyl esterase
MPLDPIAAGLLQQMADAGAPALNTLSPAEARQAAEGFAALKGEAEPVAETQEISIPVEGGEILVTLITPRGLYGVSGCLIYYHGGGWVIGDRAGLEPACHAVATRGGCRVANVEYRLSPEHKFPTPFNDCYAVFKWFAENGESVKVDPTKLAVGGDSAGGNLAAAVALKARDEGLSNIQLQLLVYPVTNHAYDTVSYADNGDNYLLTKDMMQWFWDHYLQSSEDGKNPYASPIQAKDLKGLPTAVVYTAEFDPLRDEGEAYANKLKAAGVEVHLTRFDGQIHGFFQMGGVFPSATAAYDDAGRHLRYAINVWPPRP